MSNEPVAWMEIEEGGITDYKVWREPVSSKSIPLYTHPVNPYQSITNTKIEPTVVSYTHPVKELALTDEEMISIYEKDWSGIKCGLGRAVEQAILRKAQEK